MTKLLIIKCGETFPSIKEQFGDFEDMIIKGTGISHDNVVIVPVYKDATSLPSLNKIGAIIITGSHAMVTDHEEWSVQLIRWLQDIKQDNIPTLGICYGHQLLAEAFGGQVSHHPKGIEIGTTSILLTDAGKEHPLFSILPHTFFGHVTHYQSVITLPKQAMILAQNAFEQHQAFMIDQHIFGVQFHPEFTAPIIHAYIDEQAERLQADGFSITALHETVIEQDYGRILLEMFVRSVGLPITNTSVGYTLFETETKNTK